MLKLNWTWWMPDSFFLFLSHYMWAPAWVPLYAMKLFQIYLTLVLIKNSWAFSCYKLNSHERLTFLFNSSFRFSSTWCGRSGVGVRSVPVESWTMEERARCDRWRSLLWDGVGRRNTLPSAMSDVLARLPQSLPGSYSRPPWLYVWQLRHQRRSVHRLAPTLRRRHSVRVRVAGDYNVYTFLLHFLSLSLRLSHLWTTSKQFEIGMYGLHHTAQWLFVARFIVISSSRVDTKRQNALYSSWTYGNFDNNLETVQEPRILYEALIEKSLCELAFDLRSGKSIRVFTPYCASIFTHVCCAQTF